MLVADCLHGYSTKRGKRVLRVEVICGGISQARIVKFGEPADLARELCGWQQCARPSNERGCVFMGLRAGTRACDAGYRTVVHEDAQQTLRAAELNMLEEAVRNCCRWGTPSAESLARSPHFGRLNHLDSGESYVSKASRNDPRQTRIKPFQNWRGNGKLEVEAVGPANVEILNTQPWRSRLEAKEHGGWITRDSRMASIRPVFRVFVSSSFRDLKLERDVLQNRVFPELRQFCEMKGARFQAIDLRWGISEEAGENQQTMNICLEELFRCAQPCIAQLTEPFRRQLRSASKSSNGC